MPAKRGVDSNADNCGRGEGIGNGPCGCPQAIIFNFFIPVCFIYIFYG